MSDILKVAPNSLKKAMRFHEQHPMHTLYTLSSEGSKIAVFAPQMVIGRGIEADIIVNTDTERIENVGIFLESGRYYMYAITEENDLKAYCLISGMTIILGGTHIVFSLKPSSAARGDAGSKSSICDLQVLPINNSKAMTKKKNPSHESQNTNACIGGLTKRFPSRSLSTASKAFSRECTSKNEYGTICSSSREKSHAIIPSCMTCTARNKYPIASFDPFIQSKPLSRRIPESSFDQSSSIRKSNATSRDPIVLDRNLERSKFVEDSRSSIDSTQTLQHRKNLNQKEGTENQDFTHHSSSDIETISQPVPRKSTDSTTKKHVRQRQRVPLLHPRNPERLSPCMKSPQGYPDITVNNDLRRGQEDYTGESLKSIISFPKVISETSSGMLSSFNTEQQHITNKDAKDSSMLNVKQDSDGSKNPKSRTNAPLFPHSNLLPRKYSSTKHTDSECDEENKTLPPNSHRNPLIPPPVQPLLIVPAKVNESNRYQVSGAAHSTSTLAHSGNREQTQAQLEVPNDILDARQPQLSTDSCMSKRHCSQVEKRVCSPQTIASYKTLNGSRITHKQIPVPDSFKKSQLRYNRSNKSILRSSEALKYPGITQKFKAERDSASKNTVGSAGNPIAGMLEPEIVYDANMPNLYAQNSSFSFPFSTSYNSVHLPDEYHTSSDRFKSNALMRVGQAHSDHLGELLKRLSTANGALSQIAQQMHLLRHHSEQNSIKLHSDDIFSVQQNLYSNSLMIEAKFEAIHKLALQTQTSLSRQLDQILRFSAMESPLTSTRFHSATRNS